MKGEGVENRRERCKGERGAAPNPSTPLPKGEKSPIGDRFPRVSISGPEVSWRCRLLLPVGAKKGRPSGALLGWSPSAIRLCWSFRLLQLLGEIVSSSHKVFGAKKLFIFFSILVKIYASNLFFKYRFTFSIVKTCDGSE